MSAIYDGLEMKIKVTKMYMEQNVPTTVQMMMKDELSLSSLSCVFLVSHRWSQNGSK